MKTLPCSLVPCMLGSCLRNINVDVHFVARLLLSEIWITINVMEKGKFCLKGSSEARLRVSAFVRGRTLRMTETMEANSNSPHPIWWTSRRPEEPWRLPQRQPAQQRSTMSPCCEDSADSIWEHYRVESMSGRPPWPLSTLMLPFSRVCLYRAVKVEFYFLDLCIILRCIKTLARVTHTNLGKLHIYGEHVSLINSGPMGKFLMNKIPSLCCQAHS